LRAKGIQLLLHPVRRHQDFVEAGYVPRVLELIWQLRQAALSINHPVVTIGGLRLKVSCQRTVQFGLARLIMPLASDAQHFAVKELQQRLLVNLLLDEERRKIAIETHPH
jgi:hypothetical protein